MHFSLVTANPGRHRRPSRFRRTPAAASTAGSAENKSACEVDARRGTVAVIGDHGLALRGEFDFGNRDVLADAAQSFAGRCVAGRSLADTTHGLDAVVDASQVRFIDAASLGVLVTLERTLAKGGVRLRIQRPSAALRRISDVCGLDAALGLEPVASSAPGPTSARLEVTRTPRPDWRRSVLVPTSEVRP